MECGVMGYGGGSCAAMRCCVAWRDVMCCDVMCCHVEWYVGI